MKRPPKFILVVVALLMLPWLTSIAYANSNGDPAPSKVQVEVADRAGVPEAIFFGLSFGSITPCDLFYINVTNSPNNFEVNLYITNAEEITHYLKYLILKISIYSMNKNSQWEQAPLRDNSTQIDSVYLTLQNSPVKFRVSGNSQYRVSIDSGSYYCLPAKTGSSYKSPIFYLTLEPLKGDM